MQDLGTQVMEAERQKRVYQGVASTLFPEALLKACELGSCRQGLAEVGLSAERRGRLFIIQLNM